jgi:transcriptional regulator with XRE-family HTH domain
MLSNRQIVERIRSIAQRKGLKKDAEIARASKTTRAMLIDIPKLKTAPRLDTICKFADGLGVSITEIIYNNPGQESELLSLFARITNAQQTEILDRLKIMILQNKYPDDKKGNVRLGLKTA